MKRLVFAFAFTVLAYSGQAQMLFQHQKSLALPTAADVSDSANSLQGTETNKNRTELCLGLSAGVSLLVQDENPYRSTHSYILQIPLVLNYHLSPHWRLTTGLRYDFSWAPLKYRVTYDSYSLSSNALTIDTAMYSGSQRAHAFHSYLGVPLEFTWYPFAKEHGALSVSFDIFGAYAVSRYLSIKESEVTAYDPNNLAIRGSISSDTYGDESMLPWKLEVGVTVSTSLLGLIHGVRFYGDLLPLYREPVSGEKIRSFGMTIFL